jgi:hypothetical protein
MTRVWMVAFLAVAFLAAPLTAEAQQPGKVWRIGILSTLTAGDISGADPPTHISACWCSGFENWAGCTAKISSRSRAAPADN